MSSATSLPPPAPALARLRLPGWLVLLALAAGVAALSVTLWPQWRHNPDLSHGMFMPLLFLLLLHEARSGPPRYLQEGAGNRLAFTALLVGGLLALGMAGLYAASVDWSHPLVSLSLTLSLGCFLGAGLAIFARDSVRLIPCNWTVLVAVGLWLLTIPIPPGTYTRLTLTLQLWVTEAVLRSLHLLGIAAVRQGNIIDLANATVGVEEACSGVRSLISCVFAAVFFSATLVHRTSGRVLILVLAAPLALLMNFIRSLTLTLLANKGVDISGTWHDATGFAVLGVTAAILGALAVGLERGTKPARRPPPRPPAARGPRVAAQWTLAGGLACAAALVVFFAANTRPSPDGTAPVPNLAALLPESAAGWQVRTADLYSFSGTLKTEHLAQRNYYRETDSSRTELIIYVAYWRAGQAPVSLVASHTPDACWPGSGWNAVPTPDLRVALAVADRKLAPAEYRRFAGEQQVQNVWFWHLYEGRPLTYRDPYSAVELLRMAWRYGFRRAGDQLFVRISSNRPWEQIADEPILAAFFARSRALGL